MRLDFTVPFTRDYNRLPSHVQKLFDKQLALLLTDLRHPSLQARVVDRKHRIWKAKVDGGYRFTFQIKADLISFRAIGAHDEMERSERW